MIKARPFLKWVGGKSQLLEQFENYYPQELRKGLIDSYVEPFLGGGALFFQLSQRYKITKAYLSDLNKDLVLTYQVIQQRPDELLDFLLTDLLVQQLVLLPIQEYHLLIKNSCNWHIFFKKLDTEKGAKLMLSNSDPTNENPKDDFFEKAFAGYHIVKVSANRAINCEGERRGKISELLIVNYPDKQ